jgi:hypothetical protein
MRLLGCIGVLVFSSLALAGDAPAPATYSGDGLTLELKTGGADRFAGTVSLAEKTFPIEAHFDPARGLSGTFKAGADVFEFSADVTGDSMVFKTGGATYHLVKQASTKPNPLSPSSPADLPASPAVGAQPAAPAGTMKFTRLAVKDPGINNIEAVSFLVPAGWKAEGGIQWFPDYSILANLLMKITDPQTGAQVEFLPAQNFTWLSQPIMPMQPGQNYMGNIVYQPVQDVAQFIQTFYLPKALSQLQNARITKNEDLTKVAEQIKQANGAGAPVDARAARVRYEYESQGKTWEEDVYVTLVYYPNQMGTIWSVSSAYAFRAPKGQLDKLAPTMTTITQTARISPDWYGQYMYVQKLFMDRMNQGIKNAAAISATITRNSEEIRQMFADSYKQHCESQDRISQSFSGYIRGVDTYKNPFEDRQVQLPSGYQDAWVNSQGEYILSTQTGFDPNVGSNVEWKRMDKRQ